MSSINTGVTVFSSIWSILMTNKIMNIPLGAWCLIFLLFSVILKFMAGKK